MNIKSIKLLLLLILIATLTGCNRYEKDISQNADLYGSYCKNVVATNIKYSMTEVCTLDSNNTYTYSIKEIINSKTTKDNTLSGDIITEEVSADITKIIGIHNNETYKYKNMLGKFYECVVPAGKTFNLQSNNLSFWFDEEGQYHLCVDISKCECSTNCPQYVRKDSIIYFQSLGEEFKNTYAIGAYIVDQGLFFPELYKIIKD